MLYCLRVPLAESGELLAQRCGRRNGKAREAGGESATAIKEKWVVQGERNERKGDKERDSVRERTK